MEKNKEFNDVKKELKEMKNMVKEMEANQPVNRIAISDIEIMSSVESLKECESIANNLIKKNKKFLTERKSKLIREGQGMFQ